ncbi:MAG: sigma-70 family RNA polymerase sigma factor [Planctomycetes bacterium]|nr:sigma-70 family RNA polymerase sigma factor [Planctomycetota bacterium]
MNPPDVQRDERPHELSEIFAQHRDRLRRMVRLRMDRRLQGRVDASDVIQEAYVEAAQRYDEYKLDPAVSPFIWLRFLTGQKLIQLQRRHLGAKARDANRDVSIYRGAIPEATSAALAAQLIGKQTSPTQAAARAESKLRVQEALNGMEDIDREVLALRHFEQFSNAEVAQLLDISEDAAYKRYVRALKRLKGVLGNMPG